ncbi:hypothetical protein VHEMI00682 [[Torrubiella] hemipterigena]|uniref:Glutamyl-tRNA amidotransferase complex subunit Gta3 domain-containing protein n=1 Tax=[Torrubiella] hemipterigena TaxID=1531966 RepID=A0A0A1SJW5_9HYPO|nr:hypothetical protein VHEMI00682 [[Torrubiella] hemipterigena]
MSICASCRAVWRQSLRRNACRTQSAAFSTKYPSTASQILAKPTWSVRSLTSPLNDASPVEAISSSQLHHLLRLSALPLPTSKEEEASMIKTLQSQLQFVRAVQRVDTKGVEPLRAIRDETLQGVKERTVSLDSLREVLDQETTVGHYKRPRRVKSNVQSDAEDWDPLSAASEKAGKYFVVDAKKAGQD